MKIKQYIAVLATVFAAMPLFSQASLPAFWNCNDPAGAPTGWTLNQGTTGNFVYTSAALIKSAPASVRLDNTNEYVQVNYSGTADTVYYYITGTGASGATSWSGTFVVQESADGSSWSDVVTYTNDLGLTLIQRFAVLQPASKYVKFLFKSKATGYNVAIDDITVSDGIGGAKPELVVEYAGKTQLDGGSIQTGNGDNFLITLKNNSSSGDLIVSSLNKTGLNAADFTTQETFPFTVSAGGSKDIQIDVNTAVTSGSLKATLQFYTNDSTQLPFDLDVYSIRGNAATEPTSSASDITLKTNLPWKSVVTLSTGTELVDGYLILVNKDASGTDLPVDGVQYERGGYIGTSRVLYVGTAGDVTYDNIIANTHYYTRVFSYNGYGNFINYYTGASTNLDYTTPGLNAGSYYGSLTEADTQLVSKLRSIVRPHYQVYYSNYGATIASNFEARDTTGGKKVINCFYSGYPYVFTPPFFFNTADPNYLSREHSYPYSWMPESSQDSANYSDLHILYLVHQNEVNSRRSNYPYGDLKTVTVDFYGGKFGTDSTGEFAYEPRDFAKGAVARSQFYICATYNRPEKIFTIPTANDFLGMNQDQGVLKRWNKKFPPTNWEIARSEYIASVQKNRNPFVDHPDWACYIDFSKMAYIPGGSCGVGPIDAVNTPKKSIVSVNAFPNPAVNQMTVDLAAFKGEKVTVSLTDYFERTVFVKEVVGGESLVIPTTQYASGTYLLLVEGVKKHAASAVIVD